MEDSQKVSEVADRGRELLSAKDIVEFYGGKISLRLAYKIMDKCKAVRAEGRRLVTADSFRRYLEAPAAG
jgi:hypothetical protein